MARILVTGATGTFGGAVSRFLRDRGESVRILLRDAAKVGDFDASCQVVLGDFSEPETLEVAVNGVESIFLASFDRSNQLELQGNLLAAAKRHGVRRIARISTMGVEELRHFPLFKWHYDCERQLEDSGLGFTHLRPHWVMQNLLPTSGATPVVKGKIRLPAGDGKVAYVDARDVAAVAVEALTSPSHEGKAYVVSGGEALSHGEVADALSTVSGRSIVYEDLSPEIYKEERAAAGWPPDLIETMLSLFEAIRSGSEGVLYDSFEKVTGRRPTAFKTFAEDYAQAFKDSAVS